MSCIICSSSPSFRHLITHCFLENISQLPHPYGLFDFFPIRVLVYTICGKVNQVFSIHDYVLQIGMSGKVFVGNLNRDTEAGDIKRAFERFGDVDDVSMKEGFAFVHMKDQRDADDAIKALHEK